MNKDKRRGKVSTEQVLVFRNLLPPKNAFVLGSKSAPLLQFGNRLLQKKTQLNVVLLVTWFPSKLFQETIEYLKINPVGPFLKVIC